MVSTRPKKQRDSKSPHRDRSRSRRPRYPLWRCRCRQARPFPRRGTNNPESLSSHGSLSSYRRQPRRRRIGGNRSRTLRRMRCQSQSLSRPSYPLWRCRCRCRRVRPFPRRGTNNPESLSSHGSLSSYRRQPRRRRIGGNRSRTLRRMRCQSQKRQSPRSWSRRRRRRSTHSTPTTPKCSRSLRHCCRRLRRWRSRQSSRRRHRRRLRFSSHRSTTPRSRSCCRWQRSQSP